MCERGGKECVCVCVRGSVSGDERRECVGSIERKCGKFDKVDGVEKERKMCDSECGREKKSERKRVLRERRKSERVIGIRM